MSFLDVVRRARAYLEEQRRVSLRALRREFELDDPGLDELVEELVDVQRVAVRDGTSVLVHVDEPEKRSRPVPSRFPSTSPTRSGRRSPPSKASASRSRCSSPT